ncbi:MAG: tRNA lysidine(34) synthetase TilS [Rhodocyclaceae bacterium]|nr:tRNA lysidine(34) synthetase TilS [Rhodocyclaceae bacterium]
MENSRKFKSIDTLTREIEDLLLRHVIPGQRVAIAYSGGLDSTVLLHCVKAICANHDVSLSSIHVNHDISPNADAWTAHCEQQARLLAIEHMTVKVKVARDSQEGLEASARELRYATFARLPVDWVLLAHHLDDQAETLMHNLLRGSGVLGMAGIPSVRSKYLRPLLKISRARLLDYAKQHSLTWCEDESNQDQRHARNYIRHTVLPLIAQRYPAVAAQLGAASEHFADAQRLLEDLARVDAGQTPLSFPFPVSAIATLTPIRAGNLLRHLIVSNSMQPPNQARLVEFVRQLREAGPDRHPQLDFGTHSLRVKNRQILLSDSAPH